MVYLPACPGTGPCPVWMDSDRVVTARFEPAAAEFDVTADWTVTPINPIGWNGTARFSASGFGNYIVHQNGRGSLVRTGPLNATYSAHLGG